MWACGIAESITAVTCPVVVQVKCFELALLTIVHKLDYLTGILWSGLVSLQLELGVLPYTPVLHVCAGSLFIVCLLQLLSTGVVFCLRILDLFLRTSNVYRTTYVCF